MKIEKLTNHTIITAVAPLRIIGAAENYGERYVVDPHKHSSLLL
jgi:hypothetical protein